MSHVPSQQLGRLARARRRMAALRELGPLGALAIVLVALPFLGVGVLAASRSAWLPWFVDRDAAAVAAFFGLAVLLAALSLVPSYAVGVVAGYLFGGVTGSMLAMAAIVGAAWLGKALMTPLAGERLMRFIAAREDLLAVHEALLGARGTATSVITFVRLAPVTPFAGTNLLMAAARVALVPYLLGTLLGLAPRTALVAFAGAGLAELQFGDARGTAAIAVTVVSLLAAVVGLTVVARRRLRRSGR